MWANIQKHIFDIIAIVTSLSDIWYRLYELLKLSNLPDLGQEIGENLGRLLVLIFNV